MSRVDRAVRRAARHLGPSEALLSCLLGVDTASGRRGVLVATDDRLLLLSRRGDPRSLRYENVTKVDVDRTATSGAVTVSAADETLELTGIGDLSALEVFANLATYRLERDPLPLRHTEPVPKVRILH